MVNYINTNRHRWGVIYCPKPGAMRPMHRWNEIRDYLKLRNVEFDYIQSQDYSSVERLARMLADSGYETIVLVGGDGSLQDAVNGIMSSPNCNKVALGLIPNGIANNFADYWGITEDGYKAAVDSIIVHRTRRIDVGRCTYNTEEGEQCRYFINVLNFGITALLVKIANRPRHIYARAKAMVQGFMQLLFHRQDIKMRFVINNQVVEDRFMLLSIGNALGYGMTPSAVPYNGMLDVSAMRMPKFFGLLQGIHLLLRKKIMNYDYLTPFRTTEIVIEYMEYTDVGIDGRSFTPTYPLKIDVMQEALEFIIPGRTNKDKKKDEV